jgi:hypothetical protein
MAAALSFAVAIFRLLRFASPELVAAGAQLALLAVAVWFGTRPRALEKLQRIPTAVGTGVWALLVLGGVVAALSFDWKGTAAPPTALLVLLLGG